MKLDSDLARDILLAVEASPANRPAGDIDIDGRSRDEILEHVALLAEAGLIEARIQKSGMGGGRILAVHVQRLTWEGHEFLNHARNDGLWARAKQVVISKTGTLSFELLSEALKRLALGGLGAGDSAL